jgi:hypothetical protein
MYCHALLLRFVMVSGVARGVSTVAFRGEPALPMAKAAFSPK